MQAYNAGMQYLLNKINGTMFISESIAPLFPYQYGHSRRIACDAEGSLISNTEYTMNSVSYGWWLDNLYQFNDPDIMVFGHGADPNEQQSRLINGAVTGIFLDGDDVTTISGQQGARSCLTNIAINSVAREGRTFTPVECNTGSSAVNIFSRQDGSTWLIAVFNYTSAATNETVDLSRAGLAPAIYTAEDLWSGSVSRVTNSMNVALNEKQSKLFQLAAKPIIQYTRLSGGELVFGGSNGMASSSYQVLSSTNLNLPLSGWTLFSTGSFDINGGFSVTNPVSSGRPQQFYLVTPY
jgi:hypothetical protein